MIATGEPSPSTLRVIQGGMASTPPKGVVVDGGIVPKSSDGPIRADRKRKLLEMWHQNFKASSFAHREAARKRLDRHVFIGIPLIVLTVASTVLSAIVADKTCISIVGIVVSALATALASVQTFLRLDSQVEAHNRLGARYASVLRRIDVQLTHDDPDDSEVDAIRRELDELGQAAVAVLPA